MKILLPNTLLPIEGELLVSWLLRLAQANGFSNMGDFANNYIYPFKAKATFKLFSLDERIPFANIYNSLSTDVLLFDLYRNLSRLTGISFLYDDYSIFKYYKDSFYRQLGDVFMPNTTSFPISNEIKICPDCWNQNHIIFQKHNIPGVTICTEHKKPLYRIINDISKNMSFDDILSNNSFSKIEIDGGKNGFNSNLQKSNYICTIYETKLDISKNDLIYILTKSTSFNSSYLSRLKSERISPNVMLTTLMDSYPDPLDFIKAAQETQSLTKSTIEIAKHDFLFESPIYKNMTQVKCKKCNSRFITNTWALENGVECPSCNANNKEQMSKLINGITNNAYSLNEMTNTSCVITHTCGFTRKVNTDRFIKHVSCCPNCEKQRFKKIGISKQKQQSIKNRGFEIISDVKNNTDDIEIKCSKCGKEMKIPKTKASSTISCPQCKEEAKIHFLLDKLVSKRFEVIHYPNQSNQYALLKCTTCANEISIEKKQCKRGIQIRCPNCSSKPTTNTQAIKPNSAIILEILRENYKSNKHFTIDEILSINELNMLYISYGTDFISQKIQRLLNTGKLERTSRGKYRLTNYKKRKQEETTSET